MNVPKGMTEKSVTELILKIARLHAKKRQFAIYDEDDIIQESFLIGIEVLNKYDGTKPLENFLRVSILNRLKNFYRKFSKKEIPKEEVGEKPLELILFSKTEDISEIDDIIDDNLCSYLREDYLKYKNGIKITKIRELNLLEKLREILDRYWERHDR